MRQFQVVARQGSQAEHDQGWKAQHAGQRQRGEAATDLVEELAAVDAAIDALPDPQKAAARIEWDYSSTVRRQQPLVLALAPALGLTTGQLDALFIAAAAL